MLEVISFTRAVVDLAERHPVFASVLFALWVIGTAWKALPLETRTRVELRYPRLVGILRIALFIGADVFGALRTAYYQVARGRERFAYGEAQAEPSSTPTTKGDGGAASE